MGEDSDKKIEKVGEARRVFVLPKGKYFFEGGFLRVVKEEDTQDDKK